MMVLHHARRRGHRTAARRTRGRLVPLLLACAALLLPASLWAAERHDHRAHVAPVVAKAERYKRTLQAYRIPDVSLLDQDGKAVRLVQIVNSDKPVVLNFLFATCTTVCPILASSFGNFQKALGPEADTARLISVSIDPDHDTPEVMRHYLRRFDAGPGWDFLTGRQEDIVKVMKAFDAYVDNKMNHYPLTLLRAPGSDTWVRLYGLLGTAELMAEYRKLAK